MWSMAKEEEEDPWVTYGWKYGEVSLFMYTCGDWADATG
jgi:hypothetical protein